jgi:hypothetical protein
MRRYVREPVPILRLKKTTENSKQLAPCQTYEIVPSECNPTLILDCNTVNYALYLLLTPLNSESALNATRSLHVIATYCKLVAVNWSVSEVVGYFRPFVHSSTNCSLLLSA